MSVGMPKAHLCLSQRRGMLYYYLKPQQCRMLMKFLLCCTDQIIYCYCLQEVVVSAKHLLFYPLVLLPKAILVFWPAINLISERRIEFLLLAVPFSMSLMKRTFFTIKKKKNHFFLFMAEMCEKTEKNIKTVKSLTRVLAACSSSWLQYYPSLRN